MGPINAQKSSKKAFSIDKEGQSVTAVPKNTQPNKNKVQRHHSNSSVFLYDLRKSGHNPLFRSKEGITELHLASFQKEKKRNRCFLTPTPEKKLEKLLNAGCNVNEKDRKGATPLFYALISMNVHAVRELLKRGAGVNIKVDDTPLIFFAIALVNKNRSDGKAYRLLKLILKEDINLSVLDKKGHSPLFYAVLKKDYTLTRLLLDEGASADPQIRSKALSLAKRLKDKSIINLITQFNPL